MDPLSIATLGLGVASSIPKLIAGFGQRKAANDLKLMDTTTPEEAEQLAMSRQAAATGRLPGQGQMENRLGMVQAGALQNARLGAASSADFLAAAGAADSRRQAGEANLATEGLRYQGQSRMQLRGDLKMASQRRQHDLDVYNQNKAALIQGSATNIDNGVGQIASYGAQAINMSAGQRIPNAGGNSGVPSQGYNDPGVGYYGGDDGGSYNMGARRYRPNMGISNGY